MPRTLRAVWSPAGVIACLLTFLALAVSVPAAQADVLSPWGSDLSRAPTMDTANGASMETNYEPLSSYQPGNHSDDAVRTSYSTDSNGKCTVSRATVFDCSPFVHDGADATVWNTTVSGGQATAPQGGQVLQVKVRGCAVRDPRATSDMSKGSAGQPVPANAMQFEGLTPHSDGSVTVNNVGQDTGGNPFQMPWCSDSQHPGNVDTNTVTTFQPVHMCLNQGDIVSFYDFGGFVDTQPPSYPQGVPFKVLVPVSGSYMNSMMDAGEAAYHPGDRPTVNGSNQNTGWGDEPGMEVEMQVVEGVGADAYGLCPGGAAEEPSSSNTIDCDYSKLLAGRSSNGHPICGQSSSGTSTGGGTSSSGTGSTGSTPSAPSAPSAPTPTPTPTLTRLKLNPAAFYRSKGSTITYSDNVAGLTRFVVLQQVTVKHKHRLKTVRAFSHTDHPGGQGVGGELTRMKPGRYLMQVTVTYGGKRSVTYTLNFTVLR